MNFDKNTTIIILLLVLVFIYFNQNNKIEKFMGNPFNPFDPSNIIKYVKYGPYYVGISNGSLTMSDSFNNNSITYVNNEFVINKDSTKKVFVTINTNNQPQFNSFNSTSEEYTDGNIKYYKLKESKDTRTVSFGTYYFYFNFMKDGKQYKIKINSGNTSGLTTGTDYATFEFGF